MKARLTARMDRETLVDYLTAQQERHPEQAGVVLRDRVQLTYVGGGAALFPSAKPSFWDALGLAETYIPACGGWNPDPARIARDEDVDVYFYV